MVELDRVCARFGDFALDRLTFGAGPGDYLVLLGPSGSGKTLTLELIAGLRPLQSGAIRLDGREISHLPIARRGLSIVFQERTLFPHLSVAGNIGYGLKGRQLTRAALTAEVERLAALVGVSELLGRAPATLSGGEAQRVELARAMAVKPRLLLLDEPLTSLDVGSALGLRGVLRRLNREGLTVIHVTHDFHEAWSLASRVVVMAGGQVVEQGSREEIFANPRSEFTARFTGHDNCCTGRLEAAGDGRVRFVAPGIDWILPAPESRGPGLLLFGRHQVELARPEQSAAGALSVIVADLAPAPGGGFEVTLAGPCRLLAHLDRLELGGRELEIGQPLAATLRPEGARFVPHHPR